MNRKQKIIVSVTTIFLVLLLLVGLTYAYFLTQINGNENSKSISVTTANLALVYGDGNGIIEPTDKLIPGTTLDSKTFTVKNEGNAETDYVVVIEDVKVTYATTVEENEAGTTTTFESNDFVYTLTCESDGEACDSINTETTFPINNGILVGNKIEIGKTHTYSLTVTYKETGVNQSNDMNKTLEAKVNIKDIAEINPYSDNTESLAYNIINNAILGKTGTTLLASPETTPAVSNSGATGSGKYTTAAMTQSMIQYGFAPWLYSDTEDGAQSGTSANDKSCNDLIGKYIYDQSQTFTDILKVESCENNVPVVRQEVLDYENVLSVTQDDLGTSYYYRGQVEDNYLEFNNMCWRIVRIEGDGSIKITLAAQKKCSEITESDTTSAFIGQAHYGYNKTKVTNSSGQQSTFDVTIADYANSPTDLENSMKYKLDAWLTSSGIDTSKLKKDEWCLGNTKDAYEQGTGVLLTGNIKDLMYNKSQFRYDMFSRLYGEGTEKYSTLRCNIINYETYESYIGTLTADEIVFAGGTTENNFNYYITDNARSYWWTISPSMFSETYDNAYYVEFERGNISPGSTVANDQFHIRPATTLSSTVNISGGDGTINNPYIVG